MNLKNNIVLGISLLVLISCQKEIEISKTKASTTSSSSDVVIEDSKESSNKLFVFTEFSHEKENTECGGKKAIIKKYSDDEKLKLHSISEYCKVDNKYKKLR